MTVSSFHCCYVKTPGKTGRAQFDLHFKVQSVTLGKVDGKGDSSSGEGAEAAGHVASAVREGLLTFSLATILLFSSVQDPSPWMMPLTFKKVFLEFPFLEMS